MAQTAQAAGGHHEAVAEAVPFAAELVKNASREVRMGFVRKVYGILAVQLLLTTAIAWPIYGMGKRWAVENRWLMLVAVGVMMVTMCSMCLCQPMLRKFPHNYLFLSAITAAMSILIGFSASMYTAESVLLCAFLTCAIFIGMTIFAWTTKTDFTGAGPYLFAFMLCLSMMGLTITIMAFCGVQVHALRMFYSFLAVLLFTFYIVYDTQLMMGELGGHAISFGIDDYVFASLNLYLDIVNLFLHLLALFGNRR